MNEKYRTMWISVTVSLAIVILLLVITSVASGPPPLCDKPKSPPALIYSRAASGDGSASHATNNDSGWNSGWVSITAGSEITLTHNMGGDPNDYAVDLWFLDTDDGYGVNNRGYGGTEAASNWYGAAWKNLTGSTVQVVRRRDDIYADYVRMRIWVPDPMPDYCSDWTAVGQGTTTVFTHSVGGDVDDLVAGMMFSSTVAGINHQGYGGFEFGGGANFWGGHWSNLTNSTISVWRNANDPYVQQARVCVTQPDPPAYDSGWVTVTADSVTTFTHNLGGIMGLYRVRLDTWDVARGINQYMAGGETVNVTPEGANWENLTTATVNVFNRSGPRVRVRIWPPNYIYLPLVLNNYVPSVELGYDDGEMDGTDSYGVGQGFAVCYTPPDDTNRIVGASFYLQDPTSFEIHVWDEATRADLFSFSATPTNDGWNYADLTGANLVVSDDFCFGFLHETGYQPSLGYDSDSGSGHSYEVDGAYWELQTNWEYMIRVMVERN